MSQNRLIIVAALALLLAIGGNAYLGFRNSSGLSDQTARLRATQHTLQVSQKDSTLTRVSTVAQRCALTGLLWHVMLAQNPAVAVAFQRSLDQCLVQLQTVKRIDAATPEVRR